MKRAPELVPLSHEHHHGLVLAQTALRLNAKANAAEVAKAWQGLSEYLSGQAQQHFLIEERYLLAPLASFVEHNDLVARVYDEHRQFKAFASLPVGHDLQQLQSLASLLKAHIKYEEKQLFEIAQSLLSQTQLQAVLTAHG